MPDLRAWITQHVDHVEAAALQNIRGHQLVFQPNHGGLPVTGIVTEARQAGGELQLTLAQDDAPTATSAQGSIDATRAVLRRCEADRRVLSRHHRQPSLHETACQGCGYENDPIDSVADNINDCPELLDLAHAHGITPKQYAALDRPQPLPTVAAMRAPRRRTTHANSHALPPALRGRNWTGTAR